MKTLTKTRNLIICIFTAVLCFVTALFSLRPANVYADNSDYELYFIDAHINEEDLNSKELTFYFSFSNITSMIDSYEYNFDLDLCAYVQPESEQFILNNETKRFNDEHSLYNYQTENGYVNGWQYSNTSDALYVYKMIEELESGSYYNYKNNNVNTGHFGYNRNGIIKSIGFSNGLSSTDGLTHTYLDSTDVNGYFYVTINLNNFSWSKYGFYDDYGASKSELCLFAVATLDVYDRSTGTTITEEVLLTPTYSYANELLKYYTEQDPEDSDGEGSLISEEEIAQRIEEIREGTLQNITIEYLSRIGTSKFAEKKTATVQTKVYDDRTLNYGYLETVFDVQTLDCFDILANSVEYDRVRSVYVVKYAKDVWLASKTVDGRTVNQFLDINSSFRDKFKPLLDKGYITQDLYTWFLTQVKNSDNSLKSLTYNDSNIYGYFGWCVLPKTYSLNSLLTDVFDAGTQYKGTLLQYAYKSSLSAKQYNAILNDYQYSWLSKVWNDVAGFFDGYEATYIMLVCEPEDKETVASDSGSTDATNDHGFIRNGVENAIDDIGDFVGGTVGGFLKKNKTILVTMACSAVIIGVVVIILKRKKKEKD